LKAKLQNKEKESSPVKTMRAAERLLKKGDISMAATYFWSAGNTFREIKEYELSAKAYEKAAYCYELENHCEKAAEEYLSASKMYERAGSSLKAKAMKTNAGKVNTPQKKEI